MNRPEFVMMCGLPASGKSSYAKSLSESDGYIVCSSDAIRYELYGDETVQSNNDKVFHILHKRVKENLKNGKNVVYDATNISAKRRKGFLSEIKNIDCHKVCIIMATPYEVCIERNLLRDRNVPEDVIERMYRNWNTPYYFEGWDDIRIEYSDAYANAKDVYSWIHSHVEYDQHNPHHSMSLGDHCISVGYKLHEIPVMFYAGLLHDCGKPFVKEFKKRNGDDTSIAHYYDHQNVGAYDSLFFEYDPCVSALDVSIIINLHMTPYFWERDENEKLHQKCVNLWGDNLYNYVMMLHKADLSEH